MACTSVNTFRPGSAPPTRPPIRTIELTNPSTPRRSTTVPTNNNPALATKFGSSKSTAIRSMACDTRLTESASLAGGEDDVKHRHRPSTGGLSRGYAGYLTQSSVDRGLVCGHDACVSSGDDQLPPTKGRTVIRDSIEIKRPAQEVFAYLD